jgi:hypothetical protein
MKCPPALRVESAWRMQVTPEWKNGVLSVLKLFVRLERGKVLERAEARQVRRRSFPCALPAFVIFEASTTDYVVLLRLEGLTGHHGLPCRCP